MAFFIHSIILGGNVPQGGMSCLVCPVRVWQEYTAQFLGYVHSASTPLLLATGGNKGAIVSASQLRAIFYRVTTALDLGHRRLTPHSLHRGRGGGGTCSFAALRHAGGHFL